jgi:asparagine synthase (glutamine-hydrolysing)
VLDSTRDAVAIRQRAAVDVGVLLSGGVDSSLLVGLLREVGVENLSTFSIGFQDAGGERGDEFQYSDLIAKHYGTATINCASTKKRSSSNCPPRSAR